MTHKTKKPTNTKTKPAVAHLAIIAAVVVVLAGGFVTHRFMTVRNQNAIDDRQQQELASSEAADQLIPDDSKSEVVDEASKDEAPEPKSEPAPGPEPAPAPVPKPKPDPDPDPTPNYDLYKTAVPRFNACPTGVTAYVVNPKGAGLVHTYDKSKVAKTLPFGTKVTARCQDGVDGYVMGVKPAGSSTEFVGKPADFRTTYPYN